MSTKREGRQERRQMANLIGAAYGKPLSEPQPSRAVPADTIPISPELQDALGIRAESQWCSSGPYTTGSGADRTSYWCTRQRGHAEATHHHNLGSETIVWVAADEDAPTLPKPFEHDFSEPDPDPVLHPEHYTQHPSGIQPIQITKHLNFCLGNVVKYVLRADFKGSAVQDLRKARRYLDIEIEMREQAA